MDHSQSGNNFVPNISIIFLALSNSAQRRNNVPHPESTSIRWTNGLILFFFSLIVIVSLCGNLLVCRTLMWQRRLRSNSTNVLIGVLAISDLMMTIFNIPFTVVDIILKDWIFGAFFCTLMSFVQANSVYVSSFTMAVIAINRCKVIYKFKPKVNISPSTNNNNSHNNNNNENNCVVRRQACANKNKFTFISPKQSCCCFGLKQFDQNSRDSQINIELESIDLKSQPKPVRSRFKLKHSTRMVLIVFAIWLLAALHSLPHTIFSRVKIRHYSDSANIKRRCMPIWPEWWSKDYGLILTLFTTTTQYFIPLSCAGAIYTRIGFTIMSQGKVGEMTRGRAEQLTRKKRRRLLMLVLIVAIFALCWLPFNVYYLLLDLGITESTNHTIFLICYWLAMSSVCYNPFVYCWLNEHFQKEAKNVLKGIKSCFALS